MNNSDRFIAVLSAAPGGICDDCASVKAGVFPRQQIHQLASRLPAAGRIVRSTGNQCYYCKAVKIVSSVGSSVPRTNLPPNVKTTTGPGLLLSPSPESLSSDRDMTRAWHWEGNVQAALRDHLKSTGWTITAFANTGRKESGIDLAATRSGRYLMVEVKGFPGTTYEHGEKRGLPKPTQPTNQARQWYSHALLSVMRLRQKDRAATVALCFPDFATYRRLIDATRTSLADLGVGVYLVSAAGDVTEHVSVFL